MGTLFRTCIKELRARETLRVNSCQAMYPFVSSWQLAIRGSADLVTPVWMGMFLTGLLAPLLPTASCAPYYVPPPLALRGGSVPTGPMQTW